MIATGIVVVSGSIYPWIQYEHQRNLLRNREKSTCSVTITFDQNNRVKLHSTIGIWIDFILFLKSVNGHT